MAEVGATLPGRAGPDHDLRVWLEGAPRLIDRLRKPFVAIALIFGDFVAALAAISSADMMIELIEGKPSVAGDIRLAVVPVLILTFFVVGLYSGVGPSPYERFRLRTLGVAGFVAVDVLVGLPAGLPFHLLATALCTGICLLLYGHYIEVMIRALLIRAHLWGAPTAMVGCGSSSQELAFLLKSQPELGLTPIGFIAAPDDGCAQTGRLPLSLIGTTAEHGLDRYHHIEVAVFTSARELATVAPGPQVWMPSCQLLLVEEVHDIQSLWLRTRMLGGSIGIELRRDLCRRRNCVLKRAIDILFAAPIALLACPLIAVLALAIKIVDRGPAFYVQERVGRSGAKLRMFKLRTMYADAEQRLEEHLSHSPQARAEWQRFFKLSHDPRVLPFIGNFLRRTSLDELPQLWNVVRGDMSLVGPRPFPTYHMSSFDPEFQVTRVSVQPGITGMWQVSSRSDGDLQFQKAQDLFYIRNWSIWLDVYILLQTVIVVLRGKGAK